MVDTIGFGPIAETLMLKYTNFTKDVITQRAELPLPISKCITGTMVVHLHSDNIKDLRELTRVKGDKDDKREFSSDPLTIGHREEWFPKGYKHANVLENFMKIAGG